MYMPILEDPTEFESPCKVNRTEDELKIPSFNETMSVMKNYTLKQKLKAKKEVEQIQTDLKKYINKNTL